MKHKLNLVKVNRHESLRQYAGEIYLNWENVSPHAKPYLDAMLELDQIEDVFVLDAAESIVRRFLCNAQGFRGDCARRVKKELLLICANVDRAKANTNVKRVYGTK